MQLSLFSQQKTSEVHDRDKDDDSQFRYPSPSVDY